MPERLTALDATFLELEEADPGAHMHIGATCTFAAGESGRGPEVAALRELIAARIGELPRFAERLSERHTGGLRWPSWVPADPLDLEVHVREAVLPAPADDAELLAWAARFWSQRLDRSRPLWELALIRELSDGRWALVSKMHHCLADGVGSVELAHLYLDAEPAPPPHPAAPAPRPRPRPRPAPGAWSLRAVLAPGRAVLRGAARLAGAGTRPVLHPRDTLERSRATLELLVRDELVAAPRTSLNVPLTAHRRFAACALELADVKQMAHALGGTVNDVVLSLVTTVVRRLLLERGETLPARGVRAMVPVNLRSDEEALTTGNRLTSLFVDLPVALASPLERFRVVHRRAGALKSGGQALGASTVIELAELAPPILHVAMARSLYASRLFNMTVTNVPGPQAPLYCAGSRMLEVLPLVPLAADHALGVAIFSYDGRMFFGLIGDRDALPELAAMASWIPAAATELRAVPENHP